jgi:tetratricopeptide (TPR) repeat protein
VQKQWETAANELEKTIALAGRDYPDLDYGLVAQVFLQAGRVQEAKRYARKAGLILTEQEEEPAEADADSVPETGTGAGAPMVNPAADSLDFHDKALALAEAGKNEEARENFLISLKLNPSFAQAWNNLGTLSFIEGKLDEAKEHYERALVEDPEYADAHYNLALLLAKLGDLKGARLHADRAKKLGKDISALEGVLK